MDTTKKIVHYFLYIIGTYIGTWLVLAICVILPFLGALLIFKLNNFWFLFVGGFMMTIYYFILISLLGWYYEYVDRHKPDYWFSNIFLELVALLFFYAFITRFGNNFNKGLEAYDLKEILNFKGIVFLISIVPAWLNILYVSLILPFAKKKTIDD